MKFKVTEYIKDSISKSFEWLREGKRTVEDIKDDVEYIIEFSKDEWENLDEDKDS